MSDGISFLDAQREASELGESLIDAARRVLLGGRYVLDAEVDSFEREFAEYCEHAHCIGVGNGLDALRLVLTALDVGAGDEVIVPAYTAVATWMAVSLVGATPIGIDVDPQTYNLNPAEVEAAISERTRAVIPVDLFGQPADLSAIASITHERGIALVEDAAQAVGARRHGRPLGDGAVACTFSFYPTKNLAAAGDGGAVVTNDDDLADRVRLLRAYGWRERGISERIGGNTRLDELQAAILRLKLKQLDRWTQRRRDLAGRYLNAFAGVEGLYLPVVAEWATPVWHLFVVGHDDRERLALALRNDGIGTLVHYDPLPHLTPAYRAQGWSEGLLPTAERLAKRALSLPLSPQLRDDEIERVVESVASALVRAR